MSSTDRSSAPPPPAVQARLESLGFMLGPFLGDGATSTVFAASHPQLGAVALKIGRHRTAAPALRHERAVLDRLHHPGIPDAHLYLDDVGGRPLLALSRLRGTIPNRPCSPRRAVELTLSVLAVLDHVHRRGYVHCDLKRHNLLVGHRVHLLDFGVARRIGDYSSDTQGRIAGTPAYMAPEVLTGAVVDERTDLYSLGVFLYFALTRRFPFPTEHGIHLAAKRELTWLPPSVIRAGLPESLDTILRDMLAPLRGARPGADRVRQELRATLPELSEHVPIAFDAQRDSGTTRRLAT